MSPQTALEFLTSFHYFFPNEWPLPAVSATPPPGLSGGKQANAPVRWDAVCPPPLSYGQACRVAATRCPELPCVRQDRRRFPSQDGGRRLSGLAGQRGRPCPRSRLCRATSASQKPEDRTEGRACMLLKSTETNPFYFTIISDLRKNYRNISKNPHMTFTHILQT